MQEPDFDALERQFQSGQKQGPAEPDFDALESKFQATQKPHDLQQSLQFPESWQKKGEEAYDTGKAVLQEHARVLSGLAEAPGAAASAGLVGLTHLAKGEGIAKAGERTEAALEPGYQPAPGEGIPAAAGKFAADSVMLGAAGAPLGLAARGGAEAAVPAARAAAGALGGPAGQSAVDLAAKAAPGLIERYGGAAAAGATVNAAYSTLDQMAKRGEVDPEDVTASMLPGAVAGMAFQGAHDAATTALQARSSGAFDRALEALKNRAEYEINQTIYYAKKGLRLPNDQGIIPYDVKANLAKAQAAFDQTRAGTDEYKAADQELKRATMMASEHADEGRLKQQMIDERGMRHDPATKLEALMPEIDMMVKSGIPADMASKQVLAAVVTLEHHPAPETAPLTAPQTAAPAAAAAPPAAPPQSAAAEPPISTPPAVQNEPPAAPGAPIEPEAPPPPEPAPAGPPVEPEAKLAKPEVKIDKPIKTIQAVINKKSNLPILANVQIRDGVATTTDLEVTAQIQMPGAPKDGIYKMVGQNLEPDRYEMTDFPVVVPTPEPAGAVDRNEFLHEFERAARASSYDMTRHTLNGVLLKSEGGQVSLVATDGRRLSANTIGAKGVPDGQYIIGNQDKVLKVLKGLSGQELNLGLSKDAGYLSFTGENGKVTARLVQGTFPNYQQVMPKPTEQVQVGAEPLRKALEELKPYIKMLKGQAMAGIRIETKPDSITLHVPSDPPKSITLPAVYRKANYPATKEGSIIMPFRGEKPGQIGLNPEYLSDALAGVRGKNVYIGMNSKGSPALHVYGKDVSLAEGMGAPEPQRKQKLKVKRPPAGIAAAGSQPIGTFEQQGMSTPEKEFKLFDAIEGLIKKYAKTIGEGYLPRGARGVYYNSTANIRVGGINDLSVAAHEIAHYIDLSRIKISSAIIGGTAPGSQLRKDITALYKQYYPGGSANHPLNKRIVEGFATLIQKYAEQPTAIEQQYPRLVASILQPGGQFYHPVIGEINADLKKIVAQYQGLSKLGKILARITSGKTQYDEQSFLNFQDKARYFLADRIYPIEKVDTVFGTTGTDKAIEPWVRMHENAGAITANNINGDDGFWLFRDGDFQKLHSFNVKTIIESLAPAAQHDNFSAALVARDQFFSFQEMDDLAKDLEHLHQGLAEAEPKNQKALMREIQAKTERRQALSSELARNGWTRAEITEAYEESKGLFPEEMRMHDAMQQSLLDFAADERVQIVDPATAKELGARKGHASLKRQIDEIVGDVERDAGQIHVGKTKISSMMRRTGGTHKLLPPLYNLMTNIAEVTKKGLRQIVYNNIADIASQEQELFETLQLQAVPHPNGHIDLPQERDKNIIMARVNYKRVPILVRHAIIKTVIDEALTWQNIGGFQRFMIAANRIFVRGTTALYPQFALTQAAVGQVTAAAQSHYRYIPIYTALRQAAARISDVNSDEARYAKEWMILGGERQSLAGINELPPDEQFKRIAGEVKGWQRVTDALEKGAKFLETPARMSLSYTGMTEYVSARKAGKSAPVALEQASRVFAPYHHRGAVSVFRTVAFLNPTIQHLDQFLRQTAGGTKEEQARYKFVVGALTTLIVGSFGSILALASKEQKDEYLDKEPGELAHYLWIPNPSGNGLTKIKLMPQFATIGTLINMVLADTVLHANYKISDYVSAATAILPTQFNPTDPVRAFFSALPQIIKTPTMVAMNKRDWPKIRDLETPAEQQKSSQFRFDKGTSSVAKAAGATDLARELNLSPKKIDALLVGLAGREVGIFTGKPGALDPLSGFKSTYILAAGRRVGNYWDLKKKNDEDFHDIQSGRVTPTQEKGAKVFEIKAQTDNIAAMLKAYGHIDEDKDPQQADELRGQILERIKALK